MTSQGKVQKAQAWLDRTDPLAKKLTALPGVDEEEAARSARLAELSKQAVLAEYADNGVEPVYADPARTILLSLSMLMHNGWTIEEMPDGARKLVSVRCSRTKGNEDGAGHPT